MDHNRRIRPTEIPRPKVPVLPVNPLRILSSDRDLPLHDVAATRRIERRALDSVAPYTLMQRAGLALARLAMAIAPHARHIVVAAGPGNNGGDGLEAAATLQGWGKCRCG